MATPDPSGGAGTGSGGGGGFEGEDTVGGGRGDGDDGGGRDRQICGGGGSSGGGGPWFVREEICGSSNPVATAVWYDLFPILTPISVSISTDIGFLKLEKL